MLDLFGRRAAIEPPGFHGKLPSRGDFLSRRMPRGFAGTWDAWLQALVEGSRATLGPAWLEAWLQAPVWHFSLGRKVAGPAPACGILIPSVDRVGRYFPFTILGLARPDGVPLATWRPDVEAMALAALEDGFDPAALERDLARLGPPATEEAPPAGVTRWRTAAGPDRPAAAFDSTGLPPGSRAAALVTGRLAAAG